jgi:hypothetical protein
MIFHHFSTNWFFFLCEVVAFLLKVLGQKMKLIGLPYLPGRTENLNKDER